MSVCVRARACMSVEDQTEMSANYKQRTIFHDKQYLLDILYSGDHSHYHLYWIIDAACVGGEVVVSDKNSQRIKLHVLKFKFDCAFGPAKLNHLLDNGHSLVVGPHACHMPDWLGFSSHSRNCA